MAVRPCVLMGPLSRSHLDSGQLEAFFQDTGGFFQTAVAFCLSETVQFDPLHQRPEVWKIPQFPSEV